MLRRSKIAALFLISGMATPVTAGADDQPSEASARIPQNRAVVIRSVKPKDEGESSGSGRFVLDYGLKHRDVYRLWAAGDPSIEQIVPVKWAVGEGWYEERPTSLAITATYAALRDFRPIEVTRGRFLVEKDAEELRSVIVLNEAAVEHLFPRTDPLGMALHLGTDDLVVVGIAKDRTRRVSQPNVPEGWVPLPTWNARRGSLDVVSNHGSFDARQVEIDELYISFSKSAPRHRVVHHTHDLLSRSHNTNDFLIGVPGGQPGMWPIHSHSK